ncbi:SGNH/GDSL hydrolase family protein [Pseudomonas sp.]|uniref:SGNH/GDSL hydrolase family protein n=1 Tax=Pseudomonas sp. TaxID=306 RepID=UPI002BC02928|nr:SGNH/GDSL hydrolase family protein [Pseudomonas sp.]HUE93116.1 SGNH/GDSL hydrolase family protein [Pseudomonas sp.]
MSRLRVGLWWLGLALLSPLVVPQALYTRRRALRLPPAEGPRQGLAAAEQAGVPLRLLVLGESTVVGVGVNSLQMALVGQLAAALAQRCGRPVTWRACGENGITAEQACVRLLPQVLDQPFDLALLVFGVNDTTHLTPLPRWEAALGNMAAALQGQGAQVAFSGVPPLQHFTALPWLLRRLLGMRGAMLDQRLRRLASRLGAGHHGVELEFSGDYLALDGYHPSALGYRLWAEALAASLASARL